MTTPNDTNDMSCMELVELITDYIEGTLTTNERARFDAHLSSCSGCQMYLKQMQTTIRVTGKLTEELIEPRAKNELLSAFRGWKKER